LRGDIDQWRALQHAAGQGGSARTLSGRTLELLCQAPLAESAAYRQLARLSSQTFTLDLRSAPLQPVDLPWLRQAGVRLAVLRLDLIDPELSGNKWFKLSHHLDAARLAGATGLLSLGGPHSIHLHA